MEKHYTSERHIQILIQLLKEHNIRKIVASPGTTNLTFVGSVQSDPYFQVYSSVDERSAAYLACGMAEESGEPVVLSCTGATASRNYPSGLTEAYYSKLPILAVTSTQHPGRIGHNMPQVIDRSIQFNDIVKMSKQIPVIHTEEDAWNVVTSINEALLELRHNGGGPVHLNVQTSYSKDYSVKELQQIRVIHRVNVGGVFPELPKGKIAIFVGRHAKWSQTLTNSVDMFCEHNNAVVLCDQTSNYKGKYAVYASLVCSQSQYEAVCKKADLVIHIGNISGSDISVKSENVWRVNPDGKVRDTFKKLKYVFEMEEELFFDYYCEKNGDKRKNVYYYEEWKTECKKVASKIPELPFSNVWIAQSTIESIPENSTVYFAILNTLRCWNYFETPHNITGFSNTGGFGIDGGLSSLIGASLANKDKLFFCITGDLGFFYDMNVLGNRHVGKNVRILLVNNGRGTEFTNYNHPGAQFGEDAKPFIAADGHFGRKSKNLVKHFAEDLGFEYISASSKDEYVKNKNKFLNTKGFEKPIIFEVFTNGDDESNAIKAMRSLEVTSSAAAKQVVKNLLGEKGVSTLKGFLGK